MSSQRPRRAFLRGAAVAGLAGLAGCQSGGGGDGGDGPSSGEETTYGIIVDNGLSVDDFEGTSGLSEPTPATVSLRVTGLENGETYFEQTVEVEPDGTQTIEEAFTVVPDGPTYAMSAELTPLVEGGLSRPMNRNGGLTFQPGDRPAANPIEVRISNVPNEGGWYPDVGIVGVDD